MSNYDDYVPPIPEWMAELAWRVDKIIRKFDGMERFQIMVRGWHADWTQRRADRDEWERKRFEHFQHTVRRKKNKELRNKSAGPPKQDWQWVEFPVPMVVYADGQRKADIAFIEGWAPPELFYSNRPHSKYDDSDSADLPLPLPKRELDLEEQYTVLAAVHDCVVNATERVDPWRAERNKWNVQSTASLAWAHYRNLVGDARRLAEHNKNALDALLDRVSADLESPLRAWERLRLMQGTGGEVAELDGKSYLLRSGHDYQLLDQLQREKGMPVSASALERIITEKPSRIYDRLPEPLQRIVQKPGRGSRSGYRML